MIYVFTILALDLVLAIALVFAIVMYRRGKKVYKWKTNAKIESLLSMDEELYKPL